MVASQTTATEAVPAIASSLPLPGAVNVDEAAEETATLLNPDTGSTVRVPAALLRALAPTEASTAAPTGPPSSSSIGASLSLNAASASSLRRRLREADVQSAWASGEADIIVDPATRTYRFARYPPLAFLLHSWAYVVFGAFLVAASSQITFLFPCYVGQTAVATTGPGSLPYCVPNDKLASLPSPLDVCPESVCVSRVPVTMQTYAVLLNGALAGRRGALATALYVAMVCVGAPFQAGGVAKAVWQRAALIGPQGGFFAGFILASYIMGVCAERAHDRPTRRLWRIVAWMLLAEAAIYVPAVVWFPFGLAIATQSSPSALCPDASPDGVSKCLNLIFQSLFVPFIPGDVFKMALVLATVPLAWVAVAAWHRWRHADAIRRAAIADAPDTEIAAVKDEGIKGTSGASGSGDTALLPPSEGPLLSAADGPLFPPAEGPLLPPSAAETGDAPVPAPALPTSSAAPPAAMLDTSAPTAAAADVVVECLV